MKGCSRFKGRIFYLLFALSFLLLQGWEARAGVPNLDVVDLTFFVRTNETSGIVVTRTFDLYSGPRDQQRFFTGVRLVPSGVENEWLGIENGNVIRVRSNGSATMETAAGLALNESPNGLTFDSTRGRALVATTAGEGFLFQRPVDGPWSMVSSLNNVDLVGIEYFPREDVIWGLQLYQNSPTAPIVFTKYSAAGERLADFSTNGIPVNVGPGEYACEMVYYRGWSTNIAVLIAKPSTGMPAAEETSYIYTFVPEMGSFFLRELTYIAQAPSIRFTFPYSANEQVTLGTPYSFSLDAFDIDGDLQQVELLDNGSAFKDWTFDPQAYARTNGLHLDWTAAAEGTHVITARARDGRGLTTETSVTIEVVNGKVERSLPPTVFAGQTISVSLLATPVSGTAWTVKERPPADWIISPGAGALDPVSREITWGPFNDSVVRTLNYSLTAPSSSSLSNFQGQIIVNGISNPVLGNSSITLIPPSDPVIQFISINNSQTQLPLGTALPISFEVSDVDGNLRAVELRCDGTLLQQWNFNAVWHPNTNFLQTPWTTSSAGHYTFSARAEDSLGGVTERSSTLDVTLVTGVFVYRSMPTNVIAGQSFTVRLLGSPDANAGPWTVKEQPPSDWKVTVGTDASLNPDTHEITWGPFDNLGLQRTLTYDVTAPTPGTSASFSGRVFVEGLSDLIEGKTTTYVLPPTETSVQWIDSQHVIINFNAFPGVQFIIESADSVNSSNWTEVQRVLGGDTPVQVGPIEVPSVQKFFRLRPAP